MEMTTAKEEDVTFDGDSNKYRLCGVHVRRWSTVVAILEVMLLVAYVAMVVYVYHHYIDQEDAIKGTTAFVLTFAVVFGFVIMGLRFGVKKDRPWLILVHLGFQILSIAACITGSALLFTSIARMRSIDPTGDTRDIDHTQQLETGREYFRGVAISLAIVAGLQLGAGYLIIRCYLYIRDKVISKRCSDDMSPNERATAANRAAAIEFARRVHGDRGFDAVETTTTRNGHVPSMTRIEIDESEKGVR